MCRVATISLHLAVFSTFYGGFGQKKADFGPKLQNLKWRSGTRDTRSQLLPLSFGSYFVWLFLTPIGSIHQNFGQIQSTTMEL